MIFAQGPEPTDLSDQEAVDAYVGWWRRPGRIVLAEQLPPQYDGGEASCYAEERSSGALTIFVPLGFDPGSSAKRLHSAINHCTPHASLLAVLGNLSPYSWHRQVDLYDNRRFGQIAMATADIVHCHMDLWACSYFNTKWRGRLVIQYHGSEMPDGPQTLVNHARDAHWNAIQIGARLDHGEYGDIPWVPMAQPIARLAALRSFYRRVGLPGKHRPFRIGHTPTFKQIKGTAALETVIERLRSKGVNVEGVIIEGHTHDVALAWKATCDVVFDSFFLGMQGSGLEAGAMRIPVIAGDERIKRLYEREVGYCPYLFADDPLALEATIMHLIESPLDARSAADVTYRYVQRYHSYAAVARRYLAALWDKAPELRDRLLRADHTPPSVTKTVPPIRPTDPLPWCKPEWEWTPSIVRPDGAPQCLELAA